eukprot:gene38967-47405_t
MGRSSVSSKSLKSAAVALSPAVKYPGKTEFETKVYAACCKIPKGKVATYKSLATAIGAPKAFRAVGSALRKNPYAPTVPCHRVVASDLTLGGFHGSTDKNGCDLKRKRQMLLDEGVEMTDDKVVSTCVI